MKRYIATIYCCACWAVRDSSSLLTAGSKHSSFSATAAAGDQRMKAWGTPRVQRRPPTTAAMAATEPNRMRSTWVWSAASTVAALSVFVCASVTAPLDAGAASSSSAQKPVVEALVQLADEEVDWTKLLPDAGQAPGASMIITASKERGGKPSLGASVAMDRLKFPVMMQ
ncbi:unnamed protein product, partial [Ectocarpus fasciculatus]